VVRPAGEQIAQIGRGGVVLIERRQAENQIHGLEDARQADVCLADVLPRHPGADRREDRPVAVDMIGAVLGVVLDDEDDGVLPAGGVG
jgi:hypothetical protein